MNQYILKFDVSVHDILFVEIVDGPDELTADVPDCFQGQGIIVFYILKQGLLSAILNDQAYFG